MSRRAHGVGGVQFGEATDKPCRADLLAKARASQAYERCDRKRRNQAGTIDISVH
jgi:hypothetical protein